MRDGADRHLTYLRAVFLVLLIAAVAPVASAYLSGPTTTDRIDVTGENASELTVVTIDGVGPGQIVAYESDGGVRYRNESYDMYHDVDPSPVGDDTVTYAANDYDAPDAACDGDSCVRNVVERVNLTTGDVTRLYQRVVPNVGSSQVHDVDRVNESVLLVGDIGPPDRAFMVNVTTGDRIWEWRVEDAYSPESGGSYPDDWTHLNDVEYLDDGRVMLSLRNQDQVAFVRPGEGLLENQTLGRDDAHGTLYEQHNPDYIPRENGGPAVVVADSENNRVVEYRREDGRWARTWEWSDARLQWPRDADRLPNGNTLVADSHGGRVLEVDTASGDVVRSSELPDGTYDVERLGTGDESTGGQSAAALPSGDTRGDSAGAAGTEGTHSSDRRSTLLPRAVTALAPNIVLHGVLFLLPGWFTPPAAVAVLFLLLVGVAWLGTETALYVY